MLKRLVLALLLFVSVTANATPPRPALALDQCSQHTPYGSPKSARADTTVVCREGYTLEFDNKAKLPLWVAYELTSNGAVGCYPRVSTFQTDPAVRATATRKDYAKSGKDIGHLANDGDMRWSVWAELESNLFDNAAPQEPGLNRVGWKMLEDQTRSWAIERQHNLIIYVGPIWDHQAPTFMKGTDIPIPDAFFKVEVDEATHEVMSFLYPNEATGKRPISFLTSLPEVQKRIGFVLPLPKDAAFSTTTWPFSKSTARAAKASFCAISR